MEFLRLADLNNSGSVDIREFMTAIVDTSLVINDQQIRETFDKYDDDNSGSLDLVELELLFKCKLFKKLVPKYQIPGLIGDIDVNGDKEVDFEEFQTLVQQAIFQYTLKGSNPNTITIIRQKE